MRRFLEVLFSGMLFLFAASGLNAATFAGGTLSFSGAIVNPGCEIIINAENSIYSNAQYACSRDGQRVQLQQQLTHSQQNRASLPIQFGQVEYTSLNGSANEGYLRISYY